MMVVLKACVHSQEDRQTQSKMLLLLLLMMMMMMMAYKMDSLTRSYSIEDQTQPMRHINYDNKNDNNIDDNIDDLINNNDLIMLIKMIPIRMLHP